MKNLQYAFADSHICLFVLGRTKFVAESEMAIEAINKITLHATKVPRNKGLVINL